jgi:gliding motility-associated-like protein
VLPDGFLSFRRMKIILFILLAVTTWLSSTAQQPCTNSSLHYQYLFPDSAYITKQINTADGGRLLLGHVYSGKGIISSAFVLRFNSDGAVKWGKRIAAKKMEGTYFFAIAEASNGNIIVSGRSIIDDDISRQFLVIVALSSGGDLINQQKVADFGDNEWHYENTLESQMIVKPGSGSLAVFVENLQGGDEYMEMVTIDNNGNVGSNTSFETAGIDYSTLRACTLENDSVTIYGSASSGPTTVNAYSWGPYMIKLNLKTREVGTKKIYAWQFSGHELKSPYAPVGNNYDSYFFQKNGNLIVVRKDYFQPDVYGSDTLYRACTISTFDKDLNYLHGEFIYANRNPSTPVNLSVRVDSVGNKTISFYNFSEQMVYYALADSSNHFFLQKQVPFSSSSFFVNPDRGEVEMEKSGFFAFFNIMSMQKDGLAVDRFKIMPQETTGNPCFGNDINLFIGSKPAPIIERPWNSLLTPQSTVPVISKDDYYSLEDYSIKQNDVCAVTHVCDTLKIHAPEIWCDGEKPLTITAYTNPLCASKVFFSYDNAPVSALKQVNDSMVNLFFNKPWQGKIYAAIPGCTTLIDSIDVMVASHAGIDLGKDTAIQFCSNNGYFLNAGAGFKNYTWQDSSTDSLFHVSAAGDYYIKAEDYCGNSFTDTVKITANRICDTIKISAPNTWCDNEKPLIVTACKSPSCAASVLFSFDTASVSSYKQVNDTTLNLFFGKQWQGKIYATLSTCSSQKDSVSILYAPHPRLDIGDDTLFCPDHTYTLNAGAGFKNYTWQDSSTDSALHAAKPGTYYVTAKDYCGNAYVDTVRIKDLKLELHAGNDTAICKGEIAKLSATKGLENYLWTPDYYLSDPSSATVEASPASTISYRVSADLFTGCNVSSNVTVTVKDCRQNFFIPNAFTPNGDGANDVFKPVFTGVLKGYELSIYNRFGERIFNTTNFGSGWNGFYNNIIQPNGVYIWVCQYQFYKQPIELRKGTFLLVK